MPHWIIEITKNLVQGLNKTDLMRDMTNAINIDKIITANDIKIRIYEIIDSYLGIVKQDHSYVSVDIQLLDNKTESQLSMILDDVLTTLIRYFGESQKKQSVTCRITLIDSTFYRRTVNY